MRFGRVRQRRISELFAQSPRLFSMYFTIFCLLVWRPYTVRLHHLIESVPTLILEDMPRILFLKRLYNASLSTTTTFGSDKQRCPMFPKTNVIKDFAVFSAFSGK
jgi:hypothetical protein